MRFSLHRFPRETKVAAVVLGAALLQVGVLAALGLRSTSERRRTFEKELAESTRPVVAGAVANAAARVGDQELRLAAELAREDLASPWDRLRGAMEGHVAPLFTRAYVVGGDGRLTDWRRAPLVAPAPVRDEAARARLATEVLALEHSDPARAVAAARALADGLARTTPHDTAAAALALQAGWRAARGLKDRETVRSLAHTLLDRGYAAVRDDTGPLGESEPLGPAASAVLGEVIYESLYESSSQSGALVDEVIGRRVQAQRLRPFLSEAAYRVEVESCDAWNSRATILPPDARRTLARGLEECDEIDRAQEAVAALRKGPLRDAASGDQAVRFSLGDGTLVTVLPLPRRAGKGDGPAGVAFVAPPSALKSEALEPSARALALPDGVEFVVRDAANHDLLAAREGPPLLEQGVPFGSSVPGVFANVVLVDASVVERQRESERLLWLAILGGAGLAVVAASLLAVRAVMREVRLSRMKADFVSNLSHELRTPLTSLRLFVDTLREGRVKDEAEAKECLDVVAQETDRLQSLVERVLQFASFTRGRAPIELKSADAGEVARRALAVFSKRAEAAQARIELEIDDPLPESILDRSAVVQVLLNLLDNAVKYAGHDGARIGVTVKADGAGGGVTIDVEDDGPGVPERERELVFEEFYRGDDTLSRRVEGTGIGLAVSRRIVLAHGGRLDVTRSEKLGGARFRAWLPPADEGRRLAVATSRGGAA
jgi:signal transduction histidine kinase